MAGQTAIDRALAHNAAGLAHRQAGRLAEAEAEFHAALVLRPRQAELHYNLGNLHRYEGRLELAERDYRKALVQQPGDPETRLNLGLTLLALGRFAEGWALHDERPERRNTPARGLSFPEWRGEPVAGRSIFIFPEQGLGDQIQCARFASSLKAQGAARVTLCCHPDLARLFETSGADAVLPLTDPMTIPRHDYWTLSFSAARYLAPAPDRIPGAPYLTASAPAPRPGGIGVTWRGNPRLANDASRSLPAPPNLPGTIDLQGLAGDFAESARLVAGLDLVITVDTAMAHLAGALGTPCWILLPRLGTDWRWLADRADSPWYPKARLYHQPAPGDWASVIEAVRRDLAESGPTAPAPPS